MRAPDKTQRHEIDFQESNVEKKVHTLPFTDYSIKSEEKSETHLRDYWLSVRKHLWLVAGITLITTVLSAIYMARQPDLYTAQARVQVDLENINPALGASKSGSIIVSNPVTDPAYFNTQLQNLTSAGLLRRVVKTLDLPHQEASNPAAGRSRSVWENLRRMVGLGAKNKDNPKTPAKPEVPLTDPVAPSTASENLVEAKELASYVGRLQAGLSVEPVKESRTQVRETRLIDIRFTDTDPLKAAKITNTIADTFAISNIERKTEANASSGEFIQKRIAELQGQIRKSEQELLNYAKDHQILPLDPNQNMVVERLSGLNRQLLDAENNRKIAEAAYQTANAPGAAAVLAEENAAQVSALETKMADLRQRRAQLLVEATEEWPEVKEIDQQIAVLEKQAADFRSHAANNVLSNLRIRYQQALAQERSLRAAYNSQRAETLTQNEASINYNIVQQEIATNKELLNGMLQRSKENDVMMAALVGTPNNIRVIDYAVVPDSPVGPRRSQFVGVAFIFSLGFGVALALFLEYLDDTVSSNDDVETLLRLPILAFIPSMKRSAARNLLSMTNALALRGDGGGQPLLVNNQERSRLGEAFRQLRTALMLSTAGRAPKTVLVTSSRPGEGKTTTCVNMALILARTGGSNVLLIDADMRRPRVHEVLGLKNRDGLSSILASDASEVDILAMITPHSAKNLYILTAGPETPRPAELLSSEQMRQLLVTVENLFTHVVIDSPPVESFTDGVLISTMVDGVVYVVNDGKSVLSAVRHSQRILRDVGAKILGVVLNNVDPRRYKHLDQYY